MDKQCHKTLILQYVTEMYAFLNIKFNFFKIYLQNLFRTFISHLFIRFIYKSISNWPQNLSSRGMNANLSLLCRNLNRTVLEVQRCIH